MSKIRIDRFGRIRIPNKLFNELSFGPRQKIEITIEYGRICITKFCEEDIKKRPFIGIVKEVGSANRVSIPKEYLELLKVKKDQEYNFSITHGAIVLIH